MLEQSLVPDVPIRSQHDREETASRERQAFAAQMSAQGELIERQLARCATRVLAPNFDGGR